MADEFHVTIMTAGDELFNGTVSELVLPAHDGQVGILAHHENFVGLLGTGLLKAVKGSNDYWLMVSCGVFEVLDGEVVVLAQSAETEELLELGQLKEALVVAEKELATCNWHDPAAKERLVRYAQAKARQDLFEKTH